ncbi:MAG TPA: hypothetical protein VFU86_10755 [Terriglobales bacterium]|nr:hypothetical protein [Terriglobales bacterium]
MAQMTRRVFGILAAAAIPAASLRIIPLEHRWVRRAMFMISDFTSRPQDTTPVQRLVELRLRNDGAMYFQVFNASLADNMKATWEFLRTSEEWNHEPVSVRVFDSEFKRHKEDHIGITILAPEAFNG